MRRALTLLSLCARACARVHSPHLLPLSLCRFFFLFFFSRLLVLSFLDLGSTLAIKFPLAILGACFGAAYPLVPIVELQWFGAAAFAEYHAAMYSSGIFGLLLLYRGVLLSSYVHFKDANGGVTADCGDCFKVAFRWEAGVCLFTAVACGTFLWLHDKKAAR